MTRHTHFRAPLTGPVWIETPQPGWRRERRRLTARPTLAGMVCALILLSACSEQERVASGRPSALEDPTTQPTPGGPPDTAGVPVPASDEGWSTGAIRAGEPASGVATVTGLRAAAQQGFDRVVIEFAERDLPGYTVEPSPRPIIQCGSGEELTLAGEADLMVRLHPSQAHDDAGHPTVQIRSFQPQLTRISEVRLICDYEGYVDVAIGMPSAGQFRVSTLPDPTRLIVDIRH